jgi:hypothetical protein
MENLVRIFRLPARMATIGTLLWKCVFIAALFCTQTASAQTSEQSNYLERQVKAAYLYKFASYVEWPEGVFAGSDSPLIIGVIGADAVADELDRIVAGHTANGRPITTRKLKHGDPLSGLHILFIGRIEKGHVVETLAEAKNQPLLTVTESEEAHALGSMINFVVSNDRLRFQVALTPVNISHLKISARMLTAAYKVVPSSS